MSATLNHLCCWCWPLTGCGKWPTSRSAESEGCDWKAGEWARVAALANPGTAAGPIQSNVNLGRSRAAAGPGVLLRSRRFRAAPTEKTPSTRVAAGARADRQPHRRSRAPTCHDLGAAGVDTTSVPGHVSVGAGWTDVNALAVVNSALPAGRVLERARRLALGAERRRRGERHDDERQPLRAAHHRIFDVYETIRQASARTSPHRAAANGKPTRAAQFPAQRQAQGSGKPDGAGDARRRTGRRSTGSSSNWRKAIAAYEYS
jgi:hypothetical protein